MAIPCEPRPLFAMMHSFVGYGMDFTYKETRAAVSTSAIAGSAARDIRLSETYETVKRGGYGTTFTVFSH